MTAAPFAGRDRTHPNVTLAVLAIGGLAYAMLSSLVVPALPTMQRDLHTTETGITWLLTGYLLAASVGTSIIGRLGDMYGKERLLLWTLVILAGGTLLGAVSSSLPLLAISETTTWGWGSPKTLVLMLVGVAFLLAWIGVEVRSREPLIDMTMMRVRGVWTTNAAAFLLGAGLYASFIVFPQFAQLPTRTGFGFGASVVVSGLYLLPATIGMTILGLKAGAISARFGSRAALLAGTAFATASFTLLAVAHNHPYQLLIAAALLGVGIGLAFAALGNLIVQAVPSHQTAAPEGAQA